MVPDGPRRYVVQQHDLSAFRHWDLMLEQTEALATWQLGVPPELVAASAEPEAPAATAPLDTQGIPAKRLADHRKAYLDYEGPISGDRGEVHIVDSGTYTVLAADEMEWLIEVAGRVLRGRFRLVRGGETPDGWRLIRCRGDAAAAARRGP